MKQYRLLCLLPLLLVSCRNNPVDEIQGTFEADKTALKLVMQREVKSDNLLTTALLDKVIENSVIEFKIYGDSIKGLMFLAGQSTLINGVIQVNKDTMTIKSGTFEGLIITKQPGFVIRNKSSNLEIQMIPTKGTDLSENTKTAIANFVRKEKEIAEFTDNLGRWQEGTFVDEFGDQTNKPFAFCIMKGSHETSAVVANDVFVKAIIDGGGIYFQIFNESMTIRETFPENEFGYIKIKFPGGNVESERIFLHDNIISESARDDKSVIYNHLIKEDGELKLLLDLSSASSYYSDKYQFSISKTNLSEILAKINPD